MHLSDDDLVLHYYGEMDDRAEGRARAHLDACPECRQRLTRLQQTLAVVDHVPATEPDAWFEQRMWQRVAPALVPARRASWFGRRWPAIAGLAVAATLVLVAFLAGRFWPATPPAAVATVDREPVQERVLLVDLSDHLDRSELALVEFVSGGGATMAPQRNRAEDLVAANRLYRRTAELTGDQAVADVLDDLERVLIEIAGLSPGDPDADLEAMRQRIDSRGLLFKLRVMREQLQERAADVNRTRMTTQDTTL